MANAGDQVKWSEIRELAAEINNLAEEKGLNDKNGANRRADPYCSFFNNTDRTGASIDSRIGGAVDDPKKQTNDSFSYDFETLTAGGKYTPQLDLMKDRSAPFRTEGLCSSELDLYLRFEFAYYDGFDDHNNTYWYKAYQRGLRRPTLYSQFLIQKPTYPKDRDHYYMLKNLCEDMGNDPNDKDDIINISSLIESDRDKILKFWEGGSAYAEGPTVSAELFGTFKLEAQTDGDECPNILRFAFAGTTGNGNGNSPYTEKAPYMSNPDRPYTGGYEGPDFYNESFMRRTIDRIEDYCPLTVTAADWSELSPEREGNPDKYTPPPLCGCSVRNWPRLGAEAGDPTITTITDEEIEARNDYMTSENVNIYNPFWLSKYVSPVRVHLDWCDKRGKYRKLLTQEEIDKSEGDGTPEGPGYDTKGHFSCFNAIEAENHSNYKEVYSDGDGSLGHTWLSKSVTEYGTVYFLVKPLKFQAEDNKFACLSAITSFVVHLKVKPIPAIRKRWYDMMYYKLRSIAGYMYSKEGSSFSYPLGVTWKVEAQKELSDFQDQSEKYSGDGANKAKGDKETADCRCVRWKILGVGNNLSLTFNNYGVYNPESVVGGDGNSGVDKTGDYIVNTERVPFVGSRDKFEQLLNVSGYDDPAIMWQWDEDTYSKSCDYSSDVDSMFDFLVFEDVVCKKNLLSSKNIIKSTYPTVSCGTEGAWVGSEKGGFVTNKWESCSNEGCRVYRCDRDSLILPWEGGCNNEDCAAGGDESFKKTYAYTVESLKNIYEYIKANKVSESRLVTDCRGGACYSPVQAMSSGSDNIIITNGEGDNIFGCNDSNIPSDRIYGYKTPATTESGITHAAYQVDGEHDYIVDEEYSDNVIVDHTFDDINQGFVGYIWKEVDLGGYAQEEKDIILTVTAPETSTGFFNGFQMAGMNGWDKKIGEMGTVYEFTPLQFIKESDAYISALKGKADQSSTGARVPDFNNLYLTNSVKSDEYFMCVPRPTGKECPDPVTSYWQGRTASIFSGIPSPGLSEMHVYVAPVAESDDAPGTAMHVCSFVPERRLNTGTGKTCRVLTCTFGPDYVRLLPATIITSQPYEKHDPVTNPQLAELCTIDKFNPSQLSFSIRIPRKAFEDIIPTGRRIVTFVIATRWLYKKVMAGASKLEEGGVSCGSQCTQGNADLYGKIINQRNDLSWWAKYNANAHIASSVAGVQTLTSKFEMGYELNS